MARSIIQSESLNLADDYAFTGTVSGAGKDWTKTAQTTTSGAATFTISGIPSDVTEIVVIGNAVSRGTDTAQAGVRLGDSGGLETTGYTYNVVYTANANSLYQNSVQDRDFCEFGIYDSVYNFVCRCWNTSGNVWMMTMHSHTESSGAYWVMAACQKTLSGTLDRIGIVDAGGSNFDGGTFQLWYK
jgi:hypothetical protein